MKADTPSNTGKQEGRQWETRPREGGRTIQHRHTCGETMGDKRRQDLGKAGTTSNTGTRVGRQWGTRPLEGGYDPRRRHHPAQAPMRGDNGETRPRKADTPSSTGTHVGDNGKQWHTTGDKGKPGDKKGDNGRQLGGQ